MKTLYSKILLCTGAVFGIDYIKEVKRFENWTLGFDSRCDSFICINKFNINNALSEKYQYTWTFFLPSTNLINFNLFNMFYFGFDWFPVEKLNISFNLVPLLTIVLASTYFINVDSEFLQIDTNGAINFTSRGMYFIYCNILSIPTIDIKLTSYLSLSYNLGHILNKFLIYSVQLSDADMKYKIFIESLTFTILHLGLDSLKLDFNQIFSFSKDASILNIAFRYIIFHVTLTMHTLILQHYLNLNRVFEIGK